MASDEVVELTCDDSYGRVRTILMLDGETEEEAVRRNMTQDERDMYDAMKEVDEFLEANK